MAIKFQYNKTSQQNLEKQLGVRERALPTLQNKETALRMEVKKAKDEIIKLEKQLEDQVHSYDKMMGMWTEFDPTIISVKDVRLSKKKIAGVLIPVLEGVDFEIKQFSLFKDRKSTRLNSSHVRISYAVFCLKKKNKKIKIINE